MRPCTQPLCGGAPAVKPFVFSNDPRLRDQTNIPLLTGEPRHEVIVIADTTGEFGRDVPYRTYHPRPIVGTEGLIPSAWHWTWERHGAPQLNQCFDRCAKRRIRPWRFPCFGI